MLMIMESVINKFNSKTICKQTRYPDYNFTSFDPILQEDVLVDISSTPPTYTLFGIQTAAVFDGFKKSKIRLELM